MFGWHWDVASIGHGDRFHRGWRYDNKAVRTDDLINYVTKFANTPCVWRQGDRLGANFLEALWVDIDIDEGMTLAEGLKVFEPYIHLIGTTRSHQKEKNGTVCDRYRVFLKLNGVCRSGEQYKAVLAKIVAHVGADRSCVDAARIFWPCTKIVSNKPYGRLVRLIPVPPPSQTQQRRQARAEWISERYKGKIPPFVRDYLENGCADGRRNSVAFKCAMWLGRCGFEEQEIFDLIWKSPIPIALSMTVENEIRKAVRNGIRNI